MPGSGVAGVVVSPELCDEGGQKTTNRGEERIWLELHDLHGVLLCPWITFACLLEKGIFESRWKSGKMLRVIFLRMPQLQYKGRWQANPNA